MGLFNHHAVVATTYHEERFEAVQEWVAALEDNQRSLFVFATRGLVNGYRTVVLTPDGSKEGWPDSEVGDNLRQAFIDRLAQDSHRDGSSPWDWVEVSFGELGARVVSTNCMRMDS